MISSSSKQQNPAALMDLEKFWSVASAHLSLQTFILVTSAPDFDWATKTPRFWTLKKQNNQSPNKASEPFGFCWTF